ncbi:MAG: hypothetical protein B6D39_12710 [Anaerolineae bacterium UTCFX2]|nr:zinc-ribbon domain-containing protein [Anaerolineales bacterium]OQY87606.1 MAG: hypothetical protein B6D39_12710 [Anaerolineae bacterium UTCFX2]
MSEIRCSLCGKENPEDAQVCQYCGARLTPVWQEGESAKGLPESGSEAGDLPDWMMTGAGIVSSQFANAGEDEPIPDWLKGLREDAGDERFLGESVGEQEAFTGGDSSDSELPEWLKDIIPSAEPTADISTNKPDLGRIQDEDPDWMRRISDDTSTESFVGEPELPQWDETSAQQSIPAEPEAFEFSTVDDQPAHRSEEQDIPAWLSFEKEGENIPDWLSRSEGLFEEVVSKQPESEPQFPSWIDRATEETAANEPEPFGEQPLDEAPIEPLAAGEPPLTAEPEERPFEEVPGVDEPTFDLGSWDFGAEADLSKSEEVELFDNDLSWLEKIESHSLETPADTSLPDEKPAPEPEGQEVQPADQYPDWLSQIVKPETEEQLPAFTSDLGQEAISTADLPSWLKAMRPMEALDFEGQADAQGQELPEKAGPLAGLVGALPAEPEIIQSAKPPAYTLKPRVSEMHAEQAAMLAALIEQEGVSKPVPQAPIVKTQSLQRILIGVILFAAILISLISSPLVFNAPALNSQVFAVNQLISNLQPGAPVLVVVDYSPGFSGEVTFNLKSMLAHVLAKGGHLVLVSTLPTGPVQAEQLILSLEPVGAVNPAAYTNLGFIPGGHVGVLAFAQDTRDALPFDTHGANAWDNPALLRIHSIRDFSLILIASENPDTVRTWIEQTQSYRGDTPVIVAASAQNEPVIMPYYTAYPSQVNGLLGGLWDSAQYETLLGQPGAALSFWSTFMIALSTVVLLIVVGSAINAALGFMHRTSSAKRTEGRG